MAGFRADESLFNQILRFQIVTKILAAFFFVILIGLTFVMTPDHLAVVLMVGGIITVVGGGILALYYAIMFVLESL